MNVRAVQLWGFFLATLGWIFVACTMAMEFWKIAAVGGVGGSNIIRVIWYWSSLWKACSTDTTAVATCYDFPVFWSVQGYVQGVRGLLMSALGLGMLGFILGFVGMECTFIGGNDKKKKKILFSAGLCHIFGGLLSFSANVLYAVNVSAEYYNPVFAGLSFDLGTPLFLGWVGSLIQSTGGTLYCLSVRKRLSQHTLPEIATVTEASLPRLSLKPSVPAKSKLPPRPRAKSKSELSSVREYVSDSEVSSMLGYSTSNSSTGPAGLGNMTSYV